jgi:4-amino-4-deoxy-L-arabinose transferase-like glycosyltransferase
MLVISRSKSIRTEGLGILALALSIAVYLSVSLVYLDRFPVVIGDEPATISPATKLVLHGAFGTDLFTGFYRAEQHWFQIMPLFSLLIAGSFKLFGIGMVQARLTSVSIGLITLVLTYVVGRALVGPFPAAVASVLLVTWRITLWRGVLGSGIPLLDLSRIARYDAAVAPFVLLAIGVFVGGLERDSRWRLLLAGALVGLATLCHAYGAFWLVALLLLVLWRDGPAGFRRIDPYIVIAGFLLAVAPWLAYVAQDPAGYLGQMSIYFRPRFQLLSPHFYLSNLLNEPRSYSLGFQSSGLRLGSLLFALAVPLATVALLWEAWKSREIRLAALCLAWLIPQTLMGLLLNEKLVNHIYALLPFAVLVVSWGACRLWQTLTGPSLRLRVARVALTAGFLVLVLNGFLGIRHQRALAASTTPYYRFEARIDRLLPARASVLGDNQYQLGLRSHPFRSFTLPELFADRLSYARPLRFDRALARIAPDVILMDRLRYSYFRLRDPQGGLPSGWIPLFWQYLRRHHARLVGAVADPSIDGSPVRVYLLARSAHP